MLPTCDVRRRSEVRNSFTEKCENCTILESQPLMMETSVEHVERIASSGCSGRQELNVNTEETASDDGERHVRAERREDETMQEKERRGEGEVWLSVAGGS
jgi:hypothetical protein